METVILVSVLSTLGIVAIVGTLVVMFKKLNNKVDVGDNENIYREIENINMEINSRLNDLDNNHGNDINQIYSTIDSRCDKLYDAIDNKKK